jgi:uncharacterized membrane protein HdeD (DUF308 family)
MDRNLLDNWWALALCGVIAVLFGLIALIWPPVGLAALVFLFGAYAFADGILDMVAAFRAPHHGRPWGWLAVSGLIGLAAGLITFFWPRLTALALVLVVAWWAILRGIAEIFTAIRLRKVIDNEWLLGVSGLLSVAFGVLLFVYPNIGAIALTLYIGVFTIAWGVLLMGMGFRLRGWQRSHRELLERAHVIGTHAHA